MKVWELMEQLKDGKRIARDDRANGRRYMLYLIADGTWFTKESRDLAEGSQWTAVYPSLTVEDMESDDWETTDARKIRLDGDVFVVESCLECPLYSDGISMCRHPRRNGDGTIGHDEVIGGCCPLEQWKGWRS